LEKYTGVNLDYYNRLASTKKKCKCVASEGGPKRKILFSGSGLWGSEHTHPNEAVAKGDVKGDL
jgi:hypothetical protein